MYESETFLLNFVVEIIMDFSKIWHFIWNEDSVGSWIVNLLLAFIIIKFIIYPVLGLLLGTHFPIVAVVSGSMEHKLAEYGGGYVICGNFIQDYERINYDKYWDYCGSWYEQEGITKSQFKDFRLSNGFNKGDIIVLYSAKNIEKGNIIVFLSSVYPEPIIHRVVDVKNDTYLTKGDHNGRSDTYTNHENVLGRALFKIPYLGWIKIWATSLFNMVF